MSSPVPVPKLSKFSRLLSYLHSPYAVPTHSLSDESMKSSLTLLSAMLDVSLALCLKTVKS